MKYIVKHSLIALSVGIVSSFGIFLEWTVSNIARGEGDIFLEPVFGYLAILSIVLFIAIPSFLLTLIISNAYYAISSAKIVKPLYIYSGYYALHIIVFLTKERWMFQNFDLGGFFILAFPLFLFVMIILKQKSAYKK